ncbi:MAG TPA: dihydroorotate dehydrogenase [Gemmatimonadaceae bacterium]|nr:dihydroorotate dehydrogenase [Gemmatimonadaceae bacterium]
MSGRTASEHPPPAAPPTPLGVHVAALSFRNPIVLAAGTAAFGREVADVIALERLGGIVTKAVSLHPRAGAREPRVTDVEGGMLNAVGLANPGVEVVRRDELPWLTSHAPGTRVIVNVVGDVVEDFAAVVQALTGESGIDAFELNVSCPNVKSGGMEFGADPEALRRVVSLCREATARPLFVKLSPALADIAAAARVAADAGADALTLVNTLPGLVIDVEQRRPVLGNGSGGLSGAGLLPVGVLATWKVHRAVRLPILGVGGVGSASDALQYVLAGATLVGIGTAALRDPRVPERVVRDLERWCREHDVQELSSLVGALEWRA